MSILTNFDGAVSQTMFAIKQANSVFGNAVEVEAMREQLQACPICRQAHSTLCNLLQGSVYDITLLSNWKCTLNRNI